MNKSKKELLLITVIRPLIYYCKQKAGTACILRSQKAQSGPRPWLLFNPLKAEVRLKNI
jgi:hypothetical protein